MVIRAAKIACVATLAQVMRSLKKSRKKPREFQSVEFLATKSRALSPSVATTARRRRDNFFKKSHHHHTQKIARVAAA